LAFWDCDLRYRRVNQVLAAMNGLSVEEHLGRRVSDVLPALGRELEDLFTHILATGEPALDRHIAGETPAAPGLTRHWVASYFPVPAKGAESVGIAGTVVEVTDEREARALARRAQRREYAIDAQLRAIYSALPVGVAFVTPDLRYERVNEALAVMNGRPVEEHLGRTVHEVLGEYGHLAEQVIAEVVERREPVEFEFAAPHSDAPGENRFYDVTYFPVFGPDSNLLGVGAVIRDVTDRHALEVERQQLLHEAISAREAAEQARETAESARRRASFLATVTRRMSASLDYEATLHEVVAAAVPDIADWAAITVVEPGGRLRLLALADGDSGSGEPLLSRRLPRAPFNAANVIESGDPVIVADVDAEQIEEIADSDERQLVAALETRHYGTWPIAGPEGGMIGALTLGLGHSGRRFAPDDMELARAVATRAGLHITNARLHTERTQIARTLQASLLPRGLPDIPGLELASAFLPTGAENLVGGDFYDVFASGDGVWTAIIGDVSGKGAPAAAITAAARNALRAAALISPNPAENMALLNRLLVQEFDATQFCTAVYARLCPSDGRLAVRLASGGHPPPLVVRTSGAIEPVTDGRGPVLGVLPDAEFAEASLDLEAGDLMVLYTDGVTELRPGGIVLGEQELRHALDRHRGDAAPDLIEALSARVLELHGGRAHDDITMLGIRVPPAAAANGAEAH
jgi:PAS domain S-box-containing protein